MAIDRDHSVVAVAVSGEGISILAPVCSPGCGVVERTPGLSLNEVSGGMEQGILGTIELILLEVFRIHQKNIYSLFMAFPMRFWFKLNCPSPGFCHLLAWEARNQTPQCTNEKDKDLVSNGG